MSLLIDGYNLLHVTGITGRRGGAGGFERSRQALLRFLAASIPPDELRDATIVFDAADAPAGLPKEFDHDGLAVLFARDYPDADTMLEELIGKHHAPRSLTVVSSDHRVQRAARRRRATAVDSEKWYAQLLANRRGRPTGPTIAPEKLKGVLDTAEVAYWLEEFSDPLPDQQDSTFSPPSSQRPDELTNPFPPGYGEDLLNGFDA
jgi:hypothetical protein